MEDSPKLNQLAIDSVVMGVVAAFIVPYSVFTGNLPSDAFWLSSFAIGAVAAITGFGANNQIKRSEGSEGGSEIAVVGIALGVSTPIVIVVFVLIGTFTGSGF